MEFENSGDRIRRKEEWENIQFGGRTW
jgi:hypothetical protein